MSAPACHALARILMVCGGLHPRQIGGAYRFPHELGRALAAEGREVLAVAPAAPGEALRPVALAPGFWLLPYLLRARRGPALYAQVLRGLRRVLSRLPPGPAVGAVLLQHQLASAAALSLPWVRRARPIYTCFMPYHLEFEDCPGVARPARALGSGVWRTLEAGIMARCAAVVSISRYVRERLAGSFPWLPSVHLIAPGVDGKRFRPAVDRGDLRRRLGLDPTGPLLLTVRRLEPRMGLDTLLAAVALLAPRRPGLRLVIAGAGSLGRDLLRRAGSAPLAGRVRLLGWVSEARLAELYAAADGFVVPTRSLEGFGLVVLEALAAGLPVAATRAGALGETLEPILPQGLCESGDARGLAAAIERLLDDPPDQEALRAAVLARHDWRETARAYLRLIETLSCAG